VQTITPELTAILKAQFQAAADGFRAKLETITRVTIPAIPPASLDVPIDPGDLGPMESHNGGSGGTSRSYSNSPAGDNVEPDNYGRVLLYRGATYQYDYTCAHSQDRAITLRLASGGSLFAEECMGGWNGAHGCVDGMRTTASGTVTIPAGPGAPLWFELNSYHTNYSGYTAFGVVATAAITYVSGPDPRFEDAEEGSPEQIVETATSYQVKRVSIDKSLRLAVDSAEVEIPNELLALGWATTSVFQTNMRCRIFQWYGDDDNEVQTFEGIIDRILDHREVLTTTIAIRDMMAILVDPTFSATAPQTAGEVGAVRTAANGVYLSMEVSDIVDDILDRAGWPTDDRDITETSYVLDEFIVNDGQSWADAIIGDEQLTGLVGYSAWADEFGVFHFAPTLISQNLTDPDAVVYTFRSGEDIVSLDDATDQYDLRTRVKVRGPLTTTQLEDTWREVWRTGKFNRPVGLWHDPTDAANLRVLDRGTKRMYKLRQSDRAVLSSVSVSDIVAHPLGLSGDPADTSVFWILNAPWIDGGSGGNRVKKVRKSDYHVLASFDLPSGHISAIKVSSSYIYYTNLSTDRFYRISKSDGSAIANYSHTYNGNVQANPSGLMINGSTLYLFWANGGTTARFLRCDESAPGTVTGVTKTAGTALHGGEFDTVTDVDCYGDSDSLGLVAKFTLKTAVSSTDEVFAEVVDTELEDELGELALLEDREHDTHPGDADHPYEVRRMTLDLSVITSLAQATETAMRQLDIASQRRRVLDAGIVGNPALQKTDYIAVVDPVTGVSTGFAIDTYRSQMDGDGTYLGTVALLPVEDVDDTPTDEGEAGDVALDLIDRTAVATAPTVS